jgi:DNA-binding MarR family transcriptional regulator
VNHSCSHRERLVGFRGVPPETDTRRLNTALVDVYRILNSSRVRDTTTRRSAVNISAVAGGVLRHVLDEGPIRPVDLAQRARLRPPALSRHLKNLEAEGCIERVPSPGDGRGALVRVTRRGRSAIERLQQTEDQIMNEQLRDWDPHEMDQLLTLLDRLINDLRKPAP